MKSQAEVERKLDRLWKINTFPRGQEGRDARFKHQGRIDALHWVLKDE